jgi:hypothetical protein
MKPVDSNPNFSMFDWQNKLPDFQKIDDNFGDIFRDIDGAKVEKIKSFLSTRNFHQFEKFDWQNSRQPDSFQDSLKSDHPSHQLLASRIEKEKSELNSLVDIIKGSFKQISSNLTSHQEHHHDESEAEVLPLPNSNTQITVTPGEVTVANYPLSALPLLSSNPNATAKIFLDFDGGITVTAGTSWQSYNGGANIVTPAFSNDGDKTTFTDSEVNVIKEIWQRVAEDFAPFNVDITTIDPGSFAGKQALRVAIGGSYLDWYKAQAGGVAFVGSWRTGNTPVFIFSDNMGSGNPKYTADGVSHEVGHALGLQHQSTYDTSGTKTAEYNQGSGGWAPLMGVGYYQNLTTWWNGANAYGATNYQDDMAIIASTNNGFGYQSDDYGNTLTAATILSPDTAGKVNVSGLISQTSDVDMFSFATGAGNVSFTFNTAPSSIANLDGILELRDSSNTVIASSATNLLVGQSSASINTFLNGGTYYVDIKSNGQYGRVGQYTLNGTINPTVNPAASLFINDVNLGEGNSGGISNAIFTVSLSQASSETVTVYYATADGTATAGSDYTAQTGILTFTPGSTTQTIAIGILGDSLPESNETFWLNLSGATNAVITDSQGMGTIIDDDPTLSISNASLQEGNSGTSNALFTVSLSKVSNQTVTVNYATADGTATTADNDYFATNGTLTFNPGETSKTFSIPVVGDTNIEANETFLVNLSGATNAAITGTQGIATIINDDFALPELSINDVTKAEGNRNTTNFQFTVSLSQSSNQTITVQYATADGTATTANNDYRAISGTLTFSPGQTSKTVAVKVVGDKILEDDETFSLNLSDATNGTIADSQGIGTITNDDSSATKARGKVAAGAFPDGVSLNLIEGTEEGDNLKGSKEDNEIYGFEGDDQISGDKGNDFLVGGEDNDKLIGEQGDDILVGVDPLSDAPGAGEIDLLNGSQGGDRFILGDSSQAYYNSTGGQDYALIVDFKAKDGDVIQLHGSAADYQLVKATGSLPSGKAIFLHTAGVDELVGVVQGDSSLSLNSSAFSFVS